MYKERMSNQLPYLWRDTISFITHDDYASLLIRNSIIIVHIVTFEQSAIERHALLVELCERLRQIHIMQSYARQRAHSGLNYLGVETIRRITGTEYVVNTKPITCANDGT